MRRPWLCRLGIHASTFGDGCLCWLTLRCARCHADVGDQHGGRGRVDECRRMVGAGTHPRAADGRYVPCQGGLGRD